MNDNPPKFSPKKYSTNVPEDISIGTTILQVTASDDDSGMNGRVVYSIDSGNDKNSFMINGTTGDIVAVKTLDYENMKRHLLSVQATDQGKKLCLCDAEF